MTQISLWSGRPGILLLFAIAGYCAVCLLAYLRQNALLYHPDRTPRDAEEGRASRLGFRPWPENGEEPLGFLLEADGAPAPRGTILLFHGNAGTALDRAFYAAALAPLGFRLVLAEYPGYGSRSGIPGEASFVADGAAAARIAAERFPGPLVLLGESLGSGVASGVAGSGTVPVAGLILITPWNTLPDLAQDRFWYLPAKWLTRDRYDIARNLEGYRGATAVVVAERDSVVPPRHGLRMYARLSGRKRLWRLPDAGHNDWPGAIDSAWWGEILRFLAEGPPSGGG